MMAERGGGVGKSHIIKDERKDSLTIFIDSSDDYSTLVIVQ